MKAKRFLTRKTTKACSPKKNCFLVYAFGVLPSIMLIWLDFCHYLRLSLYWLDFCHYLRLSVYWLDFCHLEGL